MARVTIKMKHTHRLTHTSKIVGLIIEPSSFHTPTPPLPSRPFICSLTHTPSLSHPLFLSPLPPLSLTLSLSLSLSLSLHTALYIYQV